jgi:hypothetical protein
MRLSGSAVLVSLSSIALAFDCQPKAGGFEFDLRALKGPYSVVKVEETFPMVRFPPRNGVEWMVGELNGCSLQTQLGP